ncbi:RteC domain-containing protein [Mucilaginibacter sp. RCC_168]|uniref:RteC domain-containing protein n=1 Tax=Mucilaginibacter sp. RCC_168 TaxID=3239221 RepID=UPI003523969C
MLFEIYEQELLVMEEALQKIDLAAHTPLDRLKAALTVIRKSLSLLSKHYAEHPPGTKQEEISYCKTLLPKIYCWYIFHQEWYAMVAAVPVTTAENVKAFWLDELRVMSRFPAKHPLHYGYYKLSGTDLDELFFIKHPGVQRALTPEVLEYDAIFPTPCGYLFAKFRAYEMLTNAIISELSEKPQIEHSPAPVRKRKRDIRWTGDSINLAEIAFGIHDTGQINDGTATLAEIFEWMEESLQIKIGRPTRRFDEIEARKKISPTYFLDRMKREINLRIDRKNSYDPEAEEEKRKRKEKRAQRAAKARASNNSKNADY